jgi:hypothetical protein
MTTSVPVSTVNAAPGEPLVFIVTPDGQTMVAAVLVKVAQPVLPPPPPFEQMFGIAMIPRFGEEIVSVMQVFRAK